MCPSVYNVLSAVNRENALPETSDASMLVALQRFGDVDS